MLKLVEVVRSLENQFFIEVGLTVKPSHADENDDLWSCCGESEGDGPLSLADAEGPTYAGLRKTIAAVLLGFIGRLFRHLATLTRPQFCDLPPEAVRAFLTTNVDFGWDDSAPPPPLVPSECPVDVEADFELPV